MTELKSCAFSTLIFHSQYSSAYKHEAQKQKQRLDTKKIRVYRFSSSCLNKIVTTLITQWIIFVATSEKIPSCSSHKYICFLWFMQSLKWTRNVWDLFIQLTLKDQPSYMQRWSYFFFFFLTTSFSFALSEIHKKLLSKKSHYSCFNWR